MIYVISDLHGQYGKYKKVLNHLKLQDDDTLYILGDVIDGGEHSLEILQDMANHPNIYPIMGDHELMAINVLKDLYNEESSHENLPTLVDKWVKNGGQTTLDAFRQLDKDEALDLLDYLQDFAKYETIDVNDKSYILVHASLNNFAEHKDLEEYSYEDLCCGQMDYEKRYFSDNSIYIISGHLPTQQIHQKPSVFIKNHHIVIDCGAHLDGGRLACLCLDTMKVIYA